ncbi:ABC transporter permease [Paracoccus benzoatiresistens]|uniref:ABC transporter permease n=1 Tax=Paracoccus benzoatiresistens TaxID=2997341 RepID=A0ABT4JC48_9RHOB|nr:ABC transporter permease [Paracoccus sp. EF6]MCZ0964494.1 ABC transporter permease [Paracoccus sp. EF6]
MKLLLMLAFAHIRGRLRQMTVAGLGVALGVGFSIAMAALMQGSQQDFVRQLVDAMPHVEVLDELRRPAPQPAEQVFAAAEFFGLRPVDDQRGIRNPAAVEAALRTWVPGQIAPALRIQAVARFSGREAGVVLYGVLPRQEAQVSSIARDFVVGSFSELAAGGNNVIMGRALADKLGAALGSSVSLVTGSGQARDFRIVGLFHTGARSRDEGEVYVALKGAQTLSGRPNAINTIRIRLDDPARSQEVAARAEIQIGQKAVSWEEANQAVLEALTIRNVIMYTVVAAIMLVAGFGIFNIVSTITHEKARDIAILKSLGFPEADMRRLFLLEGLVIGAVGSLLGWITGYGLCLVLVSIPIKLEELGGATRLPLAWSLLHYVLATGFALMAAGIAGYLPARRAARLNPVDIIRGAT